MYATIHEYEQLIYATKSNCNAIPNGLHYDCPSPTGAE